MSTKKGKHTHIPNRNDVGVASSTTSPGEGTSETGGTGSRFHSLLHHPLFLLLIFTLIAHLPCLAGGFVWDDIQYVVHNENLRNLEGLARIWFQPASSPQYYPVTFTSFWIEFQFFGLDPAGYHFFNLCLHLANTALVYWLLKKLGLIHLAWLAALLFGIHPLRVESVAWISERKDVLSGLFALSSLWVWVFVLPHPGKGPIAGSLLLFLFALLSKAAVSPLPFVMLLIAWWKEGSVSRKVVFSLVPFFVLALVTGLLHIFLEKKNLDAAEGLVQFSLIERFLIAGRSFWFYVGKTLWPYPLMPIYPRHLPDTGSPLQWTLSVSSLLFLLIPWLYRQRVGKGLFTCLASYAVLIAPAIGFLSQGLNRFSFTADHFAYLAGIGLLIPLSHLIRNLSDRFESAGMRGYLPIAALVLPFAALTFFQSLLYRNSETLFRRNFKYNPDSWGVHTALGAIALDQPGEIGKALEHFREAVRLEPGSAQAHYNLATALESSGLVDEASSEYRKALDIAPEYAEAHNNFAILLARKGFLEEGLKHINEAVRIKPENRNFRENKNELRKKINQSKVIPMQQEETGMINAERTAKPSPVPATAPGRVPGYDPLSEPESPR